MKVALPLLLIASSLLYYPCFIEEFENPKTYALIAFACFGLFFIKWREVAKDAVANRIFLFVLSAALSTYFSTDWHVSLFGNIKCPAGLLSLVSYAIFYFLLVPAISFDKEFVDEIINVMLITGVFVSLYAVAQVFGYDFKAWNGNLIENGYARPISFLGHPNFYSNYLAMVLPFVFYRNDNSRSTLKSVFYMGVETLFIGAILISLSRGMIIAAIVGRAVYLFVCRDRINTFKITPGVIIAAVALGLIPNIGQVASNRLSHMLDPGESRLEYPKGAIKLWLNHPIVGVGTDNFEQGFQRIRSERYWEKQYAGSPHRAHNDFLNILATQGIIGALAAILLTLAVFFKAKASRSPFKAPAIASIVVFYIASLSGFFITCTMLVFLLSISMLGAQENAHEYS